MRHHVPPTRRAFSLGLASDDLRRKSLSAAPIARVLNALDGFVGWHGAFGETSFDQQSFYAGPFGRQAKALYYRNRLLGTAAVAPLVFCEAFAPRSEERRVGEEGRSRWSPDHFKKK